MLGMGGVSRASALAPPAWRATAGDGAGGDTWCEGKPPRQGDPAVRQGRSWGEPSLAAARGKLEANGRHAGRVRTAAPAPPPSSSPSARPCPLSPPRPSAHPPRRSRGNPPPLFLQTSPPCASLQHPSPPSSPSRRGPRTWSSPWVPGPRPRPCTAPLCHTPQPSADPIRPRLQWQG
jgi:hypothetical protein